VNAMSLAQLLKEIKTLPTWERKRLLREVLVNQKSHSVSVDSVSMGTKNPFSGQASSQSRTPSFGFRARRTKRYWPRSSRSTMNSSPGTMPSCLRSAAGSTILPLEETIVFNMRRCISFFV